MVMLVVHGLVELERAVDGDIGPPIRYGETIKIRFFVFAALDLKF